MVGQYHRPLAGVLRPIPERQFIAGHKIAGNAVPLRFGREFRQTSSLHDDGSSPATLAISKERGSFYTFCVRAIGEQRLLTNLRKPTSEHE